MKPILLLLLFALQATAQQTGAAADFTRKAVQWMNSTEAGKRQAAYRTWLQMGPEAMDAYQKALAAARKSHSDSIDKLCSNACRIPNPYLDLADVATELDAERERVMPLIHTDFKKDPDKIAMLRKEMTDLSAIHEKAFRITREDPSEVDGLVDAHLTALGEIAREMERFDDTLETIGMDEEALRDQVLERHLEASNLMKLKQRFQKSRDAQTRFEEAIEANRKLGTWCSGAMKDFASILNAQRAVLGLPPLVIEEKLSAAAEGHSKDMARLGFFAHESPVEGKTTPWDRARVAGFQGNATGENIFAGSTSPQVAYDAWFGSDGHRFIMMADGPNVLGVGIAGNHWTMMTGNQ